MRTKPNVDIKDSRASTDSAIERLLDELTADDIERIAAAVIREHRCRLQIAQDLFEEIGRLEPAAGQVEEMDRLQRDYHLAMLNLHAQHQLVSLVINRLGYVPEVDGQQPVLN